MINERKEPFLCQGILAQSEVWSPHPIRSMMWRMAHEALPRPQISQPSWLSIHYTFTICVLSHFSRVRLCATPWTLAHQAPLSMGFSRQEHWSGLPCPPPGDLPNPGIQPTSPALQADSLLLSHRGSPHLHYLCLKVVSFFPFEIKISPWGAIRNISTR